MCRAREREEDKASKRELTALQGKDNRDMRVTEMKCNLHDPGLILEARRLRFRYSRPSPSVSHICFMDHLANE